MRSPDLEASGVMRFLSPWALGQFAQCPPRSGSLDALNAMFSFWALVDQSQSCEACICVAIAKSMCMVKFRNAAPEEYAMTGE